MSIAVISCNMGKFDRTPQHVKQSVPVEYYHFTEQNFPPRYCAMTPRMQARIPKMFGWQMIPHHDFYVWLDCSMTMTHPDAVKWLVGQCREAVFFKHPDRRTVREEAEFIKRKIAEKNYYLTPRYSNELVDEAVNAVSRIEDNLLIASTMFAYQNSDAIRKAFKEWWYQTSRYHIVDQLGLPYALKRNDVIFNLIDDHYMKTPYFTYTRNKK